MMNSHPGSWHSSAQSPAQASAQVPGELVSALMDGQLRGPLLAQTANAATQDPEALTRWRDYHLIGEVLRVPAAQQTVALSNPAFLARLEQRLADEGVLQDRWPGRAMRPLAAVASEVSNPEPLRPLRPLTMARRHLLSTATARYAAMAAVVSMAVVAGASLMPDSDFTQWAQVRPTAPQQVAMQALTPQPPLAPGGLREEPILRDRRLKEFLFAHQQAAGSSALAVPGGFFLNATFERKADASR